MRAIRSTHASRPASLPAVALIGAGFVCAFLPAVNRLPLFGYLAVGLVLAGGVAAMPWLARLLLRPLGRAKLRVPAFEMALRRLLGAPGQASIALGGIVASTGLMIAMAVMVTSFRGSVDDWLESFLSADLYVAAASNEPLFDAETQRRLAETPGVAGIAFSKGLAVTLDPELPPALLIVRPVDGARLFAAADPAGATAAGTASRSGCPSPRRGFTARSPATLSRCRSARAAPR